MRQTLSRWCAEHGRTELLDEWHSEKNAPLTPDGVSYGSQTKIWWRCAQGHEWRASAASRAAGAGCPVCAGKVNQKRAARCAAIPIEPPSAHPPAAPTAR